jgi:hypothetical protein
VIRRDVFRVVKDTLLSADRAWVEAEETEVEVSLESLGYIAAKAAQRASVALVEDALGRAARGSQAKLLRYSPETRTATFRAALASPDARLELEEAVADELGSLVDEGKVALPTIDRRVTIGRQVTPAERAEARTRVDVAASKTLLRSGCTATWEFAGDDAIRVSLIPMSEQDGHTVEAHIDAFSREVQTIFARSGRAQVDEGAKAGGERTGTGLDAWLRLARSADVKAKKPPAEEKAPSPPSSRKAAPKPPAEAPPSSKKPASKKLKAETEPAEKKAKAKKPAEKKVKAAATPAKKPAAKKTKEAPKKAAPAKKVAKPTAKTAKKTARR